jgi:hypothetical protein
MLNLMHMWLKVPNWKMFREVGESQAKRTSGTRYWVPATTQLNPARIC